MAYNPLIPQPGDKLKDSQPQIQDNFAQIKTVIDINHDTFGSATQGKHKFVTMPTQPAAPVTAAGEGAIYTKLSTLTTAEELFFRHASAGVERSMTEALLANMGWAKLPCGLMLKWGNVGAFAAGSTPKTFPVGATIPVFSACYALYFTTSGTGAIVDSSVEALGPLGFTIYSSTGGDCYFLAIGS